MSRRSVLLLMSILVCSVTAGAQPTLNRGDLLVVRDRSYEDGHPYPTSSIEVYGRDGVFEGTLVIVEGKQFGDLFYRDGIIYVASMLSPLAIERFDSRGNALPPFTTAVDVPLFLSPGPGGGVLVSEAGRRLRQFGADGSLIRVLGPPIVPAAGRGVDLAADGCTVFYGSGSRIARWNACLNSPPEYVTPSRGTGSFGALRVLPDGTFLVEGDVGSAAHMNATGTVTQTYGPVFRIALDIDGRSFWTLAACPVRTDIATAARVTCPSSFGFNGIAVVGEPRLGLPALPDEVAAPAVPALSPLALAAVAIALAAIALATIRVASQ